MKADTRWALLVAGAAAGLGALAPRPALAQATGWALDRYSPPPAGDRFLLVDAPRYARAWAVDLGLTLDHAVTPLALRRQYADGHVARVPVVSSMLVAQLNASASFAGRASVDLSLPVSLAQGGDASPLGSLILAPASGPSVGDVRLGGRVRLAGHAGSGPVSVHLGAWAWLPTGSSSHNTGDAALSFEPRVILSGSGGIARWSFVPSLRFRRSVDVSNAVVGTELRLAVALGLAALDGRLVIGPEAYLVTPLRAATDGSSAVFAQGQWGVEVMASASFRINAAFSAALGAGVGLQQAVGIPTARVLASVSWHLPDARPNPGEPARN